MGRLSALAGAAVGALFHVSCEASHEIAPVADYGAVGLLLEARCGECHGGDAPKGGVALDSYTRVAACAPRTGPAPLLLALGRPDHAGLLSADERDAVAGWVAAGAPSRASSVHPPRFLDARDPDFHGALLRRERYAPMLDEKHALACGRCHDGAPVQAANASAAAGAPSCTSCHATSGGVLACTTCHDVARVPTGSACSPPASPNAHARHLGASPSRAPGFACQTCHPVPSLGDFSGAHASGRVEVWFDFRVAGPSSRFDAVTKRCDGTCHSHGGGRPSPAWTETGVGCTDCHGVPPAGHAGRYAGACTQCHREVAPDGAALLAGRLHLNGRVDLGDGSGRCGACHGRGDDPTPSTGAHAAHASPKASRPVPCETCHDMASVRGAAHPTGRGVAAVRFAGLAVKGGARATFDPATKSCRDTYCHGGLGGGVTAPRWTDGPAASACDACHGAPPPPPHAAATGCGSAICHEGAATPLHAGAPGAAAAHVDGIVTRRAP